MTKKEVTEMSYQVTGCPIRVHKELGPGLLESVYQKCLKHELIKKGFSVKQQVSVPVIYDEIEIDTDLRLDLIVNNTIKL